MCWLLSLYFVSTCEEERVRNDLFFSCWVKSKIFIQPVCLLSQWCFVDICLLLCNVMKRQSFWSVVSCRRRLMRVRCNHVITHLTDRQTDRQLGSIARTVLYSVHIWLVSCDASLALIHHLITNSLPLVSLPACHPHIACMSNVFTAS